MLIRVKAPRKSAGRAWWLVTPIAIAILMVAGPGFAQNVPVAQNDSYFVSPSAVLSVAAPGILLNDSDADGDPFTAALVSGPANGTLGLNADGSFTYSANFGFSGTDTFTYQAVDVDGPSAAATVSLVASPGIGALSTGCVNESNGLKNNCTANDLTFVQLGLGEQRDGCVNSTDRVKIFLRGAVQNTTAQGRYDVGLWFPRPEPVVIDPNGDGALSGSCYLAGLMNPEPTPPTDACVWDTGGVLDLRSGSGPWVNADGTGKYDACGDVYSASSSTVCDNDGDGTWDDSIVLIDLDPQGIEINCTDDDGTGILDGFVNMPVCLTWGNQVGQVDKDGNGLCDSMNELQPGTKSKCRCEQSQPTDIPAPELSLSCPSAPTIDGTVVTMVFSYDNACTCTPVNDPNLVEYRYECCTASYVEFEFGFDADEGEVLTAVPGGSLAADDVSIDNSAGTITWRPGSASAGDAIIPQGDSDTLTVRFELSDPPPSSLTPFTMKSFWANSIDSGTGAFVAAVSQSALGGSCTISPNYTWAGVSDLTAEVREGRTVVSWETSAEVGTVGFDVLRSEGPEGPWVKVNETLVPALGDGPGGRYELVDTGAPTEGAVRYKIREVDGRGRELETRPAAVVLRDGASALPRDGVSREPRQPSPRMTKAKNRAAATTAKSAVVRRTQSKGRVAAEQPVMVKVGVAESGLYRLSVVNIAVAMDETVATIAKRIEQHKLALTTGGLPVAWMAEPNAKGILFYGEAPDSIYDAERYYMLRQERGLTIEETGESPSQPDTAFATFPDTVVFEKDVLLRPFDVFEEGADYWFWDAVLADDQWNGERTLEVELEGVVALSASARMKLSFVGFAPGPTASGSVFVNDHYVGTVDGPILSNTDAVVGFDRAYLKNGVNTIRVVGLHGGMLIDRIEISYDRRLTTSTGELTVRSPADDLVSVGGFTTNNVAVYDITDPLRPGLLQVSTAAYAGATGVAVGFVPTTDEGTYLVVSDDVIRRPASVAGRVKSKLRGNPNGADYLIITTTDLATSADRLAVFRQDRGLDVMVVDVEDIFDDFSFGSRDPAAITAFLAYAAENWITSPRYVLLAGRGHYDYMDLLGYGGNLVPPMLVATQEGLVPSDNKLVDLNGDGLPDLAIGRLPVLDAAELDAAVDKIIAYENRDAGPWARQVMLVADDPDEAGDFVKSSDSLAQALASDREVEKVYLFDPYPATEVNALLKGALNEGVGIVNWTGHAGFDSFANERVLTSADVEHLKRTAHPSLVVGLTCLVNNFGFPYLATLGEEMALLPRGGAIGVWAASGLSVNGQAEILGEKFMAALGGQPPQRLGDIILTAIDDYAAQRIDRNLVNQFELFGDPALILK